MATGGKAETTPLMLEDDDNPRSLEAKEARLQMRRENASRSLPQSAIRKLERRVGAR
ncbi:hypothetical protein SEA_WOLLYPOG_91 [Arthrobacter phage Wollypog]|uniref:Uncharacterized protein n=1 Tax=Arthrobacter phage Wollypog TaxID=2790985 RepID=A0A7T3KCK8_9CAUD|nr:hypothetical protein PP291_gp91 [Arthrobacter phage Wollypog]QPX62640.1 hypothetical protein SEA_WOLLYPOG_91 [Arthrobacter phage Wollypog]